MAKSIKKMNNFWQNKKVLITGHTGFKGTWLSLWLEILGAKTIGFSLSTLKEPNFFNEIQQNRKITNIFGDIRDFNLICQAIIQHEPEIIIHMAAQPLVIRGYEDPIETYSTNVMGTVNLFEAARKVESVKVILNITTDKCYENKEWPWGYRENDSLGGKDPYSNSKACSEFVTHAYRCSYFNFDSNSKNKTAIGTARAGNVIGGGDFADNRLVPDIIKAYMKDEPIYIRNPDSIRPWQNIFDLSYGYLLLVQKLYEEPETFSGSWNFGPENSDIKSVLWIANYAISLLSKPIDLITMPCVSNMKESKLLMLDSTKSRNKLNWSTSLSLEKGLQNTIEWYQNYMNNSDIYKFSIEQLNHFMNNVNETNELVLQV